MGKDRVLTRASCMLAVIFLAEPPHREFNLMPKPRALLPNSHNPKKTQSSTTTVMELPEHEADC